MSIAQSPAPVKGPALGAAAPRRAGGAPLAERVADALRGDLYAFAFEYDAGGQEEVYGCYRAADLVLPVCSAVYALEAVGGRVTSCNCPDHTGRGRVCKHMVLLALLLGYGLVGPMERAAGESPEHPAAWLHAPTRVLDCLPADWTEDWK